MDASGTLSTRTSPAEYMTAARILLSSLLLELHAIYMPIDAKRALRRAICLYGILGCGVLRRCAEILSARLSDLRAVDRL